MLFGNFKIKIENILKMSIIVIFWLSLWNVFTIYIESITHNKIETYLTSLILSGIVIAYFNIREG